MAEAAAQAWTDGLETATLNPQTPAVQQAVAERYDFNAPKKFSRDNLSLLDSIFTGYARLLETQLSGMLRLNCEVRLLDISEQKYTEYVAGVEGEVQAMADFDLGIDEAHAPMLVWMSTDVTLTMMDRLMGGPGTEPEGDFESYTDIELALLEKLNTYFIPLMNDAWKNYFPVSFAYKKLRNNPRLVQELLPDDTVVTVVFNVTVQEASGPVSVCVPGKALELLFKNLEESKKALAKNDDTATRQAILANISNSVLELTVKLDETELTLKDLFEMKVDDVIHLKKPIDSDASLCVEGIPWFTGELGVHKQKMALKINDYITAPR